MKPLINITGALAYESKSGDVIFTVQGIKEALDRKVSISIIDKFKKTPAGSMWWSVFKIQDERRADEAFRRFCWTRIRLREGRAPGAPGPQKRIN